MGGRRPPTLDPCSVPPPSEEAASPLRGYNDDRQDGAYPISSGGIQQSLRSHGEAHFTGISRPCPPTNHMPQADKFDLILQEIRNSRAAIEQRKGAIAVDLGILRDDHMKLAEKVRLAGRTPADLAPQQTQN
ncbi:hypothetical protein NDU88_005413 [Pleurodeles waltl]|uniref:Uncharacterized protein n=1 Tax=Pleurodeles waltl TaxID=8319 RepID=A0AAV7UJJ4_PLEWA|nr:hypothetical protein NDU88_005413 [Pleurodeles waltl]